MKVEVAVLGSPSLTVRTVSVDVKQYLKKKSIAQSSPSLIILMVSVDVKQHLNWNSP